MLVRQQWLRGPLLSTADAAAPENREIEEQKKLVRNNTYTFTDIYNHIQMHVKLFRPGALRLAPLALCASRRARDSADTLRHSFSR